MKFGVIPSVAPYVLPHLLPVLQERHPDLELELRETQTRFLVEELIRGALDVVMIALPTPQAEIETLALFDDAFLLAAPAGDDLPSRARITADDIDPTRLILLEEGHCLRDQALAFCAEATGGTLRELGATSLTTVMQMVANGYGVTLISGNRGAGGSARRAREAPSLRQTGAVSHRRSCLAQDLVARARLQGAGEDRDGGCDVAANARVRHSLSSHASDHASMP